METTAVYTTTPSSTSAGNLLGQVQAIIDERDAYKTKCERQNAIIAKLSDLMFELQAFIDETPMAEVEPKPTKTRASQGSSSLRYTENDVLQWAAALREGMSQVDISVKYQVSTKTLKKRLKNLGYNPVNGLPLDEQQSEPEPKPEPLPEYPPVPAYDITDWARLIDAGRTPEWIGDQYDVDPYLVRGLVRGWREEHGETVEEA